jgi:DNA integrity scanning protein DisA with diadenylate cyclase activity
LLTTWVFQILWQVLIILLLILFQSEIRQVLEKVSPLRYLRSRRRAIKKSFVNDLSHVAFDLAAQRTGALFVLTRDDNPSEFIHGGQAIMALPDPVLMKSIFNRNSPAHDGAVVISRERISHMGCILPLSEKEDLPEQFGTRHRAALGLSEVTDAVCIVVSEERSEVSTVVEGQISSWQHPDELSEKLTEWIGGPEIRVPAFNQFFKAAFLQNWKTKLGALVLVTVAWLILAAQQQISINTTAPVRYSNLPGELIVDRDSTSNVILTLAGRRHRIEGLKNHDTHVLVDLNKLAVGEHWMKISRKNLALPAGIKVDRINPQEIAVILRPLTTDLMRD